MYVCLTEHGPCCCASTSSSPLLWLRSLLWTQLHFQYLAQQQLIQPDTYPTLLCRDDHHRVILHAEVDLVPMSSSASPGSSAGTGASAATSAGNPVIDVMTTHLRYVITPFLIFYDVRTCHLDTYVLRILFFFCAGVLYLYYS